MRKNSLNLPLVGGLITVLGAASPALGLEEPKPPRNDLAEETPIEERVKAGREKISKQVDGSKGKKWDSPLVDLDQQDHAESVHEEKSPEVRHEEVKREIARSIAEAQKAYEERQKDQKDKKTAGKDSKKKPQILVGKSKDSFLLDLTNEKPRKKNEPAQSHVFDSRSAQSGEQRVFQIGGELDLLNTDQGKLITTGKLPGIVVAPNNPGAKATFKLEGQAKNRGFLEKLFGWNKEKERETLTTLASGKSGEMSTSNSHPTADLNASMKGVSLKKRLEMELDRKREESRAVDPGQEKYLPPATTVDLDRMQSPVGAIEGHPVTGFNEGQAEVPTEKQDGKIAKQPSVEEIHAALEAQFAKGIDSHDMVEREWAFRYAGTYRKFEAIPSLLQEIKARGVLAPLAVGVLGALDPAHREVEKVLFNCLNGGEPPMRQAAAAAFGRMGTESALRPLLQRLKIEKNYHVRKTLCTALGSLGLPGAVKDLRVQLESPGEVEEVKAQAALALAQLGDRSGKNYLLTALASSDPQLQILGISGLAMLNDPDLPGYLGQALDSPHEAIWIAAAEFFPCVGHAHALPLLRPRLLSPYLGTRRRAALALGMLGRDDGLPVLEECLREGTVGDDVWRRDCSGCLESARKHRSSLPRCAIRTVRCGRLPPSLWRIWARRKPCPH